ncbi:MAG TPA: NAD(P)/FAD-dependent oxidoreductase [Acetobacteraceae bacterium]|nr:NAD(P)/FAD-dependent oxidoreductase [Acetobacteraceae bacterium]
MSGLGGVKEEYDLVVVGAGPAGMAAAVTAAERGLSVLVADQAAGPGGQVFRAITAPAMARRDVLGADYWRGAGLARAFAASGADYVKECAVWYLDAAREVGLSAGGTSRAVAARRVILATGALERPTPVKGWTLPGVMTVGAAQTLLKSAGVVASGRVVLAGAGPLLWLLAAQYLAAGVKPALILETVPRGRWRAAAREVGGFLLSPYARKGLALMGRVRSSVRVVSGVAGLAVEGDGRLEVTWEGPQGVGREAADHVLLHQGVVPDINLAAAAGCALAWNEAQACWRPVTDGLGNTSLAGIAVAGDGAGIGGAEMAEAAGRIAALAAAAALGRIGAEAAQRMVAAERARARRFERGRAFLDAVYRPAREMRLGAAEAMACRCEEVSVARVREVVASLGVQGPNQLKAFLRCGMGPCQGRFCGLTVGEIIADVRGVSPAEVGYYRLRPPVKPITVAELAGMARSEADVRAVVRS